MWGLFVPSQSSEAGYRLPAGSVGSVLLNPPSGVDKGLYKTCSDAADRELLPGNQINPLFSGDPTSLPDGGPYVPTDDPRYAKVVRAWSFCMQKSGYPYTTPLDAINDPQWATKAVSKQEAAVALQDVRCKLKVNLVGVGMAVQAGYDRDYIARHKEVLLEYESSITKYIRSAASS
jgi:hypothetical protein